MFELDTKAPPLNYMKIFQFAVNLAIFWEIMFLLQILHSKFEIIKENAAYFALVMVLVFIIGLIIVLIRSIMKIEKNRTGFLGILFNIIISPFGKVRFKHVILADIITSMIKMLNDFHLTLFFIFQGCWLHNETPENEYLPRIEIICLFFPLFWRFNQNINKLMETRKANPFLLNMGKYFSGMVYVTINSYFMLIDHEKDLRFIAIIAHIIVTMYSYLWDVIKDWGLFKSKSKHFLLKDNLLYPRKFYYFALVTNFVLRFIWTSLLIPQTYFLNNYFEGHFIIYILASLEVFRRSQWVLLRTEHEAGTQLPNLPTSLKLY